MDHRSSFRRLFQCVLLSAIAVFTLQSAPLTFSGSVSGTAAEDFAGRCGTMITVNATGTGSSNLLGAFSDTQSHCDTSFTTFGNGQFTLVSQAIPSNTLSGTYNGSAAIGTGGALTFSAILTVNTGSGQFANYAGTLNSNGLLSPAGGFQANFSGQIDTVPEPATFLLLPLGAALSLAHLLQRRAGRSRGTAVHAASPESVEVKLAE